MPGKKNIFFKLFLSVLYFFFFLFSLRLFFCLPTFQLTAFAAKWQKGGEVKGQRRVSVYSIYVCVYVRPV